MFSNREYYTKRRQEAIAYLGGKCVDCGIVDERVLEFDHKEPRNGNRTIAAMMMWDWSRLQPELDKCDLVCANCHTIRTYNRRLE